VFVPVYLILFGVFRLLTIKLNIRLYHLLLVMIFVYFLYGYILFGMQFWHLKYIMGRYPDINKWIEYEHRDLYFSITSLLGFVLFTWLGSYTKLWRTKKYQSLDTPRSIS
jgi:hypothetical protein